MINVGVVFGGQSPEHEVSVITSIQAASALETSEYNAIPIYIAKSGVWYTGDDLFDITQYKDLDILLSRAAELRLIPSASNRLKMQRVDSVGLFGERTTTIEVDILFLGLHGGSGENGGLQGLCEVMNVPYTGSGVLSSSLAMDKARSKDICRDREIPVVDCIVLRENAWAGSEETHVSHVSETLGLPVVVKPLTLGSSIGISMVDELAQLEGAIEEAFRYDETVIVEHAVQNLREINCSVLGTEDNAIASILEEPVSNAALLSYEEKYMQGGSNSSKSAPGASKTGGADGMASLGRIIPAPLSAEQTERITSLATSIFSVLGCAGVARIDFLLNDETGDVYFNEINTIPGSLSFYLWDPVGLPFDQLVTRLIEIGFERHRDRTHRIRSYDINLLANQSARGLKGRKS
jgi:D-alanine-D-alanine ligase